MQTGILEPRLNPRVAHESLDHYCVLEDDYMLLRMSKFGFALLARRLRSYFMFLTNPARFTLLPDRDATEGLLPTMMEGKAD